MATAKTPKKAPAGKASKSGKSVSARDSLLARIAESLGITPEQAELRALSEMAERLGVSSPDKKPAPKPAEPVAAVVDHSGPSGLPKRLFLLMEGRGLDGRGLPVEVIDFPCVVGSGRRNGVWINSPQIETRHLSIAETSEGWVLEDLGSEHGTFFNGKRVKRRVLQQGDEFSLAGYLRLRTEFH